MRPSDLLHPRPEGLWCPLGGFFVDPMRPVDKALITHGHADHARTGHGSVLATQETLAIMGLRYGPNFSGNTQVAAMGVRMRIGDITVHFHPAGHILGSAQIAIEWGAMRIVVSGDYKRAADPTCQPFEPVPCDVFVTEATFALPVFQHPSAAHEVERLLYSVRIFPERSHLVGAYSLGKAQRLVRLLRMAGYDAPIHIHGAMDKLMAYYQSVGIDLGALSLVTADARHKITGGIVLCPPSSLADRWSRRFVDPMTCFASGWMQTRARARQRGVELPLIVSDHADWPDLLRTIRETGCSELWVTHGQEEALVHWAQMQGIAARPLHLVGYDDAGDGTDNAERLAENP